MNIKEIRKEIRKCKKDEQIYQLFKSLESKGIQLDIKRRSYYEPADTKNADYRIFNDGKVTCFLPPNWSCSFKDIKQFSYNIKIR